MPSNGYVIGYLSGYRRDNFLRSGYLHGYAMRKEAQDRLTPAREKLAEWPYPLGATLAVVGLGTAAGAGLGALQHKLFPRKGQTRIGALKGGALLGGGVATGVMAGSLGREYGILPSH